VLDAGFALLDAPRGPAFTVWPDPFDPGLAAGAWSPSLPVVVAPDPADEMSAWRPAYDAYVHTRGRTSVGLAVDADGLVAAAAAFVRIAAGVPFRDAGLPGNAVACALDLRTYHEEAALGASGMAPAAGVAAAWFLDATATGRTLRAARDAMRAADAPFPLWYYLTSDG
jgi:hypothetical protein